MPPSDSATCRSGNRSGTPDQSHSPAARRAFTGNTVGNSSNGGSGEGSGAQDDAPVCRQTTVAVSSQAAKKGSHAPLKMEGSCNWAGNSGKLTALKPRAALARTSDAATLDVGQPGQLQGDDAVGVRPRPHLQVPVVEGAQAGEAELLVRRPRVDRTAEPRHERGKAQRGPDAGAVHVENAGVDVEAAGPHFVEAGRLHAPLGTWAPHDGVETDVGIVLPLEDPALRPVLLLDDAAAPPGRGRPGRRCSNRSGGSIRWSSTEITGIRMGLGSGSGSRVALGPERALYRRFPREGDTIVSNGCPARGCA